MNSSEILIDQNELMKLRQWITSPCLKGFAVNQSYNDFNIVSIIKRIRVIEMWFDLYTAILIFW